MEVETKEDEAERVFRENKEAREKEDRERLERNRAKREKAKARKSKGKKGGGGSGDDEGRKADEGIKKRLGPQKVVAGGQDDGAGQVDEDMKEEETGIVIHEED